jgi:hypothetical protein
MVALHAGVTQSAVTSIFASEQECVLAAVEGLARLSRTVDEDVARKRSWLDRLRAGLAAFLAGSVPGWDYNITNASTSALHQPRYLSDSGRLFFDSPDQLVPQATNAKEDVYEYEPEGVGSCGYSSGCIGLISSGSSIQESTFLDASEPVTTCSS